MDINIKALRDEIDKKQMSIQQFSRIIGINPSTFYRKVEKGGEGFTVGQMHKIGEALGLSNKELANIFLI